MENNNLLKVLLYSQDNKIPIIVDSIEEKNKVLMKAKNFGMLIPTPIIDG